MSLLHYRFNQAQPYFRVAKFHDTLVRGLLDFRASPNSSTEPCPAVITTQFRPVYTCGRRDVGKIAAAQRAYLQADGRADFFEASRGGQTTFHGPGQLVAYPVLDLKRHGISPRDYVRLLEDSVIETCRIHGVSAGVTQDPGVWTSPEKKICAVGIHLRRWVTSHGIGLNVNTDLWWFDRIIACGLPDKEATSLQKEGVDDLEIDVVATEFVNILARRLRINVVEDKIMADSDAMDP